MSEMRVAILTSKSSTTKISRFISQHNEVSLIDENDIAVILIDTKGVKRACINTRKALVRKTKLQIVQRKLTSIGHPKERKLSNRIKQRILPHTPIIMTNIISIPP
ncbi:hypothetical protein LXL04_032015 [Taraxacum kok-saghyz]